MNVMSLPTFDDFKNKQKSVSNNNFDIEKYVYSENLFDTLYIEIEHKF